MHIDVMNRRIISILQRDARSTYKDIAFELRRSESTIRDRILRLEREGAIRGYSAIVEPEMLGFPVQAMVRANVDPARTELLLKQVASLENVARIYHVMGDRRVLIHVVAQHAKELQGLVEHQLIAMGLTDLGVDLISETLEGAFSRPRRRELQLPPVTGATPPSVMVVRR